MQEIAEGVVVSTEFRRINVGAIATGRGIVCIDVPPYPQDAQHWRSMLLERFKQPLRLVVLTDAQPDRLMGLHWFDEARVIAHDATFDAMRALPGNFIEQTADLLSRNSEERHAFGEVKLHYPCVTFNDRMTAYIDNTPLPLTAMPGPTPGNVWVHLVKERIVFTGDSVVAGDAPYMKHPRSKDWLNSLTILRRPRFAADLIIPGRGPLTDKSATVPISEFLRYARRRVQNLCRAGHMRTDMIDLLPEVLEHLDISKPDDEDIKTRVLGALESMFDEFLAEEQSRKDTLPELE